MTKQRSAVGDTGDSEQIKAAQRNDRQRAALLKEDMKWLLGSPSGRRVMQSILDKCFIERATTEEGQAIYILARQEVGFAIKREIEMLSPAAWLLMEKERLEREGLIVQSNERQEPKEGDE